MIDVGTAIGYLELDTSKFTAGLSTAAQDLRNFMDGSNSTSDRLASLGSAFTTVGSNMTKNFTLPLVGVGTAAVKITSDFESSMAEVQAISGATGDDFKALSDKAREMGATTKFSASDSAEALKYMAMAGWGTNDMLNSISGVMNLAAASGENLGTVSDIVTDAMTAFGLSADGTSKVMKNGYEVEVANATRFTDVLAAASNSSNTNVSMLGESFKYVAPMAGALGYSVEDTAIALGLMANSGIKASQGGTALRAALSSLLNPTDKAAGYMEKYGVSLADSDGNSKSLMEVMQNLRTSFGDMGIEVVNADGNLKDYDTVMSEVTVATGEGSSELEKLQAITSIFGREAMPAMLSIIQAAPADFEKLTGAIYNANGTAQEMADIMGDTLQGKLATLGSALAELAISVGQEIIPLVTNVVLKITEWVNAFNSLDEGTKRIIVTIAGIVAAVGPVLLILGQIITAVSQIGMAIGTIIDVVSGVGTAVSGLWSILAANPIAAVIAIVAALVAGLMVLWQTNEGFRDAVGAIWDAITETFRAAWEAIKAAWEGAVKFFQGVWEGISNAFSAVVEFFSGIFSAAWEAIQAVWSGVVEFFSGIWEAIKAVFSSVAEVLGGFFKAAWEAVKAAWEGAKEFFQGIWEGIKSIFSVVAEVLGGFFKAAWEAVKTAWSTAKEFFSELWTSIKEKASEAAEAIKEKLKEAWETIKAAWEGAKQFFSDLWSSTKEAAEKAATAIGEAFKKAWDALKSAWDGAVNFFSGIKDKIVGVFNNIGENFREIGTKIVEGIKNGVMGAWSSFTGWVSEKVGGVVNTVTGAFSRKKTRGSYASGLDYVPQDGLYKLHEGERILTKDENRRNSNSGGDTYNFYSPKALDARSAAREMKKAKQELLMGYI